MSVTAKELARLLGLSETAVSMALNNKPGVSTATRARVICLAEEKGYDMEKHRDAFKKSGAVYFVIYKASAAILSYTPIFNELLEGIKNECRRENIPVKTVQIYAGADELDAALEDLRADDCIGIILLGTEAPREICARFAALNKPVVLLDTCFDSLNLTSVLINNLQGAYLATEYLISKCHAQPGHLKSSYLIPNFEERSQGYYNAIKNSGMSPSRCLVQVLSPSIEGAMADMLELLDRGDDVAPCYFADNDIIAIGAIKALKIRGYRVPQDVAVIGFDNISEGRVIDPSLTTMDVPRFYMGETAARYMIMQLSSRSPYTSKIEISVRLIKRFSV